MSTEAASIRFVIVSMSEAPPTSLIGRLSAGEVIFSFGSVGCHLAGSNVFLLMAKILNGK
jgi:hypothetical protein